MIEIKELCKSYGDKKAVNSISFNVQKGEILGLLGPNGAGKSTTMNMITGFIEPTEGEIIVNGYNIDEYPKKVKSQIGYMPEGTPLYADLTVKEFVTYMADLKLISRKDRKAAVEKAIASTGLEKVQNNLTKNLSRGYKQRVSMAGAIVGDPKILILDEPTVGLDPKQVIEIRELIKAFGKDHTVLVSSHILSEVSQMCEKVVIIDKGEIIAVDTPEHLESKTTETITLEITVDDTENKIESIKEEIQEITKIKLIKQNDDNSKNYVIETNTSEDIRKKIFSACAKNEITILEMKKTENSLEDAFIKLVADRKEYSQKEIKKMQYEKELEELREEDKIRKEERENRKIAKKEEKARKAAAKEAKKDAKQKMKEEKQKTVEIKDKKTSSKNKEEKNENDKKGGNE